MSNKLLYNPGQLLECVGDIGSAPQLYHRLNSLIQSKSASMDSIVKLLGEDPSLAARLLKLANSAMFGFQSKIATMNHAVTVIGLRNLHDLVLATTVLHRFSGISESLVSAEDFWKQSLACAISCRLLASYAGYNTERMFVVGLLSDIGRLLMIMAVPDLVVKIFEHSEKTTQPLIHSEREILGFTHADVGGELLRSWDLPESIASTVQFSHQPMSAGAYIREAALLHVAEIVAGSQQKGTTGDLYINSLDGKAWDVLKISEGVLQPLLELFEIQYDEAVEHLLPVDMGLKNAS